MGWMKSSLRDRAEMWIPLVVVCAFFPSLKGGFIFDDVHLIVENAYVKAPAFWLRAFGTHFWDVSGAAPESEFLHFYRPLVTVSYLWNWWLGFGQAWTFHLVNVLLHALNAGLVLTIALRLTKSRSLAILSALVFALHPTRWEAVTWVSGRPDLLMTAFVLLTVQCVHWGGQRRVRPLATLGAALAFACALLSKEPALATPLVLLADGARAPKAERAWRLSMVALTAALGVGYLVLRSWLLPVSAPPLVWTPATALVTLSHYAERALYPWPLTFFYKPEELGRAGWAASPWEISLGLALALGLVVWGARSWRRDRASFWLIAASVGFLGPLLNFTQTGARVITSDRFLYLPLWLLLLAACRSAAGGFVVRRWSTARLALAGACAIGVLANATRAFDFADERTLWTSELSVNPDSPVALRGLAAQAAQAGETEQALAHLERSLQGRALRFHRVVSQSENVDTYGKLLALKASTIPDGSVGALQVLVQDGVDRLAGKSRQSRPELIPIDWPTDQATVSWLSRFGEGAVARHLVTVSTRLDVHDVSTSLLDAISDDYLHLAPNPLLIALAEAREQRFARAVHRIAVMRQRRVLMPKVVTDAALVDCEARIDAAQEMFASAPALGPDDASLTRARGFATVGAFLRGLLEVQKVDPRHPGMLPLYVQLLMSARLEQAALQVASQALGIERAKATVEGIRAQLPPDLRALPPATLAADVGRPDAL